MKSDLKRWKIKNSVPKKYIHFDRQTTLKKVWRTIDNPANILSHNFFPFIHFTSTQRKYSHGKTKLKKRDLYYCSHLDRYVYAYYSFKLNCDYNSWVKRVGLDQVAVAYRTDLRKSTINFAESAFSALCKMGEANVLIGDFTNYFDQLDHSYLKERIKQLLNVKALPSDYYQVFRRITQFSFIDEEDIICEFLHKKGPITPQDKKFFRAQTRSLDRLFSPSDFRSFVKKVIQVNKKSYGIPQGSPISSVLSNIYLMNFDMEINTFVKTAGGFYMRYCDDFIVIVPKSINLWQLESSISVAVNKIPRLELKAEKIQKLTYSGSEIRNENGLKTTLNFLGFSFDGDFVRIRDKTISRYYKRLYAKIKTIKKQRAKKRKGGGTKNLYLNFSKKGSSLKSKGNLFSYIHRAKLIFNEHRFKDEITKRHMGKIRKRLKTS